MTIIEARQQIANLLSLQAVKEKKAYFEYALNDMRVDRHILTIRGMSGRHWNSQIADEYVELLKNRLLKPHCKGWSALKKL